MGFYRCVCTCVQTFMYVYIHVSVRGMCTCVYIHMKARGLWSGAWLYCSPSKFLRQGFSPNPTLTDSARPAIQQAQISSVCAFPELELQDQVITPCFHLAISHLTSVCDLRVYIANSLVTQPFPKL